MIENQRNLKTLLIRTNLSTPRPSSMIARRATKHHTAGQPPSPCPCHPGKNASRTTAPPLRQKCGLHQISAIIHLAERHHFSRLAIPPMRPGTVKSIGRFTKIQHSLKTPERLLPRDESSLAPNQNRHQSESRTTRGHQPSSEIPASTFSPPSESGAATPRSTSRKTVNAILPATKTQRFITMPYAPTPCEGSFPPEKAIHNHPEFPLHHRPDPS
jgi:hypothetical protein